MFALPLLSEAKRQAALENYSCPHLAAKGCTVYAERPIICRVFGTTPRLPCPHGRRPDAMIDPAVDAQIEHWFLKTRQVLV